jgi:hypothetical protein
MSMNLHQFNQLTRNEQRVCLLTEGTFLEERSTLRHDVMLYELDGFYVEAFFLKNTNKAAFFKTFTDTTYLEPYLQQINLRELFEPTSH